MSAFWEIPAARDWLLCPDPVNTTDADALAHACGFGCNITQPQPPSRHGRTHSQSPHIPIPCEGVKPIPDLFIPHARIHDGVVLGTMLALAPKFVVATLMHAASPLRTSLVCAVRRVAVQHVRGKCLFLEFAWMTDSSLFIVAKAMRKTSDHSLYAFEVSEASYYPRVEKRAMPSCPQRVVLLYNSRRRTVCDDSANVTAHIGDGTDHANAEDARNYDTSSRPHEVRPGRQIETDQMVRPVSSTNSLAGTQRRDTHTRQHTTTTASSGCSRSLRRPRSPGPTDANTDRVTHVQEDAGDSRTLFASTISNVQQDGIATLRVSKLVNTSEPGAPPRWTVITAMSKGPSTVFFTFAPASPTEMVVLRHYAVSVLTARKPLLTAANKLLNAPPSGVHSRQLECNPHGGGVSPSKRARIYDADVYGVRGEPVLDDEAWDDDPPQPEHVVDNEDVASFTRSTVPGFDINTVEAPYIGDDLPQQSTYTPSGAARFLPSHANAVHNTTRRESQGLHTVDNTGFTYSVRTTADAAIGADAVAWCLYCQEYTRAPAPCGRSGDGPGNVDSASTFMRCTGCGEARSKRALAARHWRQEDLIAAWHASAAPPPPPPPHPPHPPQSLQRTPLQCAQDDAWQDTQAFPVPVVLEAGSGDVESEGGNGTWTDDGSERQGY